MFRQATNVIFCFVLANKCYLFNCIFPFIIFCMSEVGKRIEYAMRYRKMNTVQLAEAMGLDRKRISQWIHGFRNPKYDVLVKIGEILKVQTAYFIDDKHFDDPIERIEPYLYIDTEEEGIQIKTPAAFPNIFLERVYIKSYLDYLTKSELDDVVVTLNKHLKNHVDE